MGISRFTYSALSIGVAAALLGACSSSQSQDSTLPSGAPSAMRSAVRPASSYEVLYRFSQSSNGEAAPYGGLVALKGTLYGTTSTGGAYGAGTVYGISDSGAEKTIYSFHGGYTDGANPEAGLTAVNGALYGTTYAGGSKGVGIVFSVTTSGVEKILHTFKGGDKDGARPQAGLTNVNGTLYGTTSYGGGEVCKTVGNPHAAGCGTVYSITTSGSEKVLHDFGSGSDGTVPCSAPIAMNGTLYGTTISGGTGNDGTVYSISPSGSETVLHNFTGSDGENPEAGLVDVKGMLYGTTGQGGKYSHGTVYSVSSSGAEHVVFNFATKTGGEQPNAGLLYLKGTFYGTTPVGGTGHDTCPYGCGTLYSLTPGHNKPVLHDFAGGTDGKAPSLGGLVDANGTIYGTTFSGGGGESHNSDGAGTVYKFTP